MGSITLDDNQRLDWLRLIRSERVGPRTFRALVNQFGGARAALDALPDLAHRAGRRTIRIASIAEAERELVGLRRLGGRFIAQGEDGYPLTLLAIDTAPPLIAIRGSAEALGRPTIAIVGSRNASASGLAFAERLAGELGRGGYSIVSGLARGIDTRAHRASVATGTIAVLAGGHDLIYPSENIPLLDRMVGEGGAALTEMPVGWEPRGRDFPRRNRIVSGLSYGVIVVEAAKRSGSLITARYALEQGREVFAVPGSPMDPRAEGTNELIRSGATLCASSEHVISVIEPLLARGAQGGTPLLHGAADDGGAARYVDEQELWDELSLLGLPEPSLAAEVCGDEGQAPPHEDRDLILDLLSAAPVTVDELARQSGISIRSVQLALVELELRGRIERHSGGGVSRLPYS